MTTNLSLRHSSLRSPSGALPPGGGDESDTLRRRPLYAAVHELTGAPLHDGRGELLGHVGEVVVDVGCGRIAYALLPWGGFMGLGERLIALPWRALAMDASTPQRLVLEAGRDLLEDAPGLARDEALPPPRSDWHRAVHRHFDVEPYWD